MVERHVLSVGSRERFLDSVLQWLSVHFLWRCLFLPAPAMPPRATEVPPREWKKSTMGLNPMIRAADPRREVALPAAAIRQEKPPRHRLTAQAPIERLQKPT